MHDERLQMISKPLMRYSKAFRKYDFDNHGHLTCDDFARFYKSSEFPLPDAVISSRTTLSDAVLPDAVLPDAVLSVFWFCTI